MREMRRLGATEEEALEGRRAPGVDALEDAKPTEVSELELQAVQSLVMGVYRDAEPPFTLSDFFMPCRRRASSASSAWRA